MSDAFQEKFHGIFFKWDHYFITIKIYILSLQNICLLLPRPKNAEKQI